MLVSFIWKKSYGLYNLQVPFGHQFVTSFSLIGNVLAFRFIQITFILISHRCNSKVIKALEYVNIHIIIDIPLWKSDARPFIQLFFSLFVLCGSKSRFSDEFRHVDLHVHRFATGTIYIFQCYQHWRLSIMQYSSKQILKWYSSHSGNTDTFLKGDNSTSIPH